ERAEAHDDDAEVRRWSSLALLRLGKGFGPDHAGAASTRADMIVDAVLRKAARPDEKYAAALAVAEHGDARGEAELIARWSATFLAEAAVRGELDEAREMLAAFAALHSRNAVPLLVHSLDDVRLRPHIVETLAEIGDLRAKEPLLRVFAEERYVHVR